MSGEASSRRWVGNNSASWGGGVFGSLEGSESIYIYNSTIANNVAKDASDQTAYGGGAGIRVSIASGGTGAPGLSLINSTVSGNVAEASAGGIQLTSGIGGKIRNSTITDNRAGTIAGGLHNDAGAPILMQNTILAGNTAVDPAFSDGWGSMSGAFGHTSAYNIVGVADTSFGLSTLTTHLNQVGTILNPKNPQLSPLTAAGGLTLTHVPLPGSPAIDNGANGYTEAVGGLYVDQRGSARQVNDPAEPDGNGNYADVGAVESDARIGVGDFNGDGREDQLRYSPTLKSLLVAEKSASIAGWEVGAWGSAPLATEALPYGNGLIVGDFNGDGRDDVMVLNMPSYTWLLGISDGSMFHVEELKMNGIALQAGWAYAYVGDFDGDGAEELIGKSDGGAVWLAIEHDGVTGSSALTVTTIQGFTPGAAVFVQDANRDGRDDLITRMSATAPWMVSLGGEAANGAIQFQAAADWDSWIDYGFDVDTSKLDADKATAKVIEEFAWVYNNVELELYPGMMKGPEATRQTKAGNDWDQAALLERQLQAIGAFGANDVQIATGRVRIDAGHFDSLTDWLGVTTVDAAFNVIQVSLDAKVIPRDASGGDSRDTHLETVAIEFTHAWVKARVPTSTGLNWVDLDASWKFKDRQAGVPVSNSLDQVHTAQGLFDEFSYLGLNPVSDHRLPVEFFEDQVMQWLASSSNPAYRGKSLAEVPYDGPIKSQIFQQLSAGLASGMTLAAMPETAEYPHFAAVAADPTLTHRVRISMKKGDTEFWFQDLVVPVVSLDAINVTFAGSFQSVGNADSIAAPGSANYFGRLVVGGDVMQAAQNNEFFLPTDKVTLEVLHLAPTRVTLAMSANDPAYVGPSTNDVKKSFTEKPGEIILLGLEAN